MINKEAIDYMNVLQAKCENGYEAEAINLAIKAIEVVEKIKKAFIESDTQYDKADILDCNNCTHFTGETYNILGEAQGTEEDRESWLKDAENDK